MTGDDDPATRRWHLEAYAGKAKEPDHRSVCIGDQALDDAMKIQEASGLRCVVRPA